MTWKVGPLGAWLELVHDTRDFAVYGEYGALRGFTADSSMMGTPSGLSKNQTPRPRYKDSWSVSKSNTVCNGAISSNYFVTPEANCTPQIILTPKLKDQSFGNGNFLHPSQQIIESNSWNETETEGNWRGSRSSKIADINNDPHIDIKSCDFNEDKIKSEERSKSKDKSTGRSKERENIIQKTPCFEKGSFFWLRDSVVE